MEEAPKPKLTPAERLEKKVKASLAKRDALLEALDKEIVALEGRLGKAKALRESLGGGQFNNMAGLRVAPSGQIVAASLPPKPTGPLRGFRSNGPLPPDPIDAMIREGKLG